MNRYSTYALLARRAGARRVPRLCPDARQPRVPRQHACGKPKEEGGGCGCGCGCSVWVAYTDDGKTLAYTDDADGDGKADDNDNCPFASNRDQARRRRRRRRRRLRQLRGRCRTLSSSTPTATARATPATPTSTATAWPTRVDNCPAIPNARPGRTSTPTAWATRATPTTTATASLDAQRQLPRWWPTPTRRDACRRDPCCNVDADGDNVGDTLRQLLDLSQPSPAGHRPRRHRRRLRPGHRQRRHAQRRPTTARWCPTATSRRRRRRPGRRLRRALLRGGRPSEHGGLPRPQRPLPRARRWHLVDAQGRREVPPAAVRQPQRRRHRVHLDRGQGARRARAPQSEPEGRGDDVAALGLRVPGRPPTFTADVDGEYTLQLQAHLAFADRAYPEIRTSVSSLTMKVDSGSSCSAIPVDGSLAGLGLALLALIRRRR